MNTSAKTAPSANHQEEAPARHIDHLPWAIAPDAIIAKRQEGDDRAQGDDDRHDHVGLPARRRSDRRARCHDLRAQRADDDSAQHGGRAHADEIAHRDVADPRQARRGFEPHHDAQHQSDHHDDERSPVARGCLRKSVAAVLPQHIKEHDDRGIRRARADQDIHGQAEQEVIADEIRQHQDGEDSADDESDRIGCHADRLPAPRNSAAIKPTTISPTMT